VNILTIAQFYPPLIGGEERMAHDLSVGLARRGHRVAVATLWHEGQPAHEVTAGVDVYRIRSSSARLGFLFGEGGRRYAPPAPDPGAVAGIRAVLARERPDVVHGHNWLVHSFLPLKRSSGAALLLSVHDSSLACAYKRLLRDGVPCSGPGPAKCIACSTRFYGQIKGPLITSANALMYTFARSLVDLFLPVSEAVAAANRLAEHGCAYQVVPNFLPAASCSRGILPPLPPEFILFVGDVTYDKGVAVLLASHALLSRRLPLVLIGRNRQPELVAAAANDVHVLGPLPHDLVLEAWRRATVAVVPSIVPEGFPLVALEAMAAGRPVIASRTGGLPEVVVDEETGLLVGPGDVGELQRALERLLADESLRRRLGRAGRERAGLFSAQNILPQVEEAYTDALEHRRGTS
jgi:glycosyltransferase involved in cell wall biosynthesis